MFLENAPITDAVAATYDASRRDDGYVPNWMRLWAWRQDVETAFRQLRSLITTTTSLSSRECAVIVCATVSGMGDSYCSLAWGEKLAGEIDAEAAASVLRGGASDALTPRERALAEWARKATRAPNETNPADVETLRRAGLSDREIFEATVLAAFRLAFSTVNDALGAEPDAELFDEAPQVVRDSVTYGRPAALRNVRGTA